MDTLDFEKILGLLKSDANARDALIGYYMTKIPDIAKLYEGQGVLEEDLIGEGNLALVAGVHELPEKCNDASAAEGILMKGIMDAMEELIRSDRDEREKDEKLVQKVDFIAEKARELFEEMGRKITVEELAVEKELNEELIREAIRLSGKNIDYFEF